MNDQMNLRVCLALDEDSARKLDRMAIDAGISRSAAMRELISRCKDLKRIPKERKRTYTPWNDRVGRPCRG